MTRDYNDRGSKPREERRAEDLDLIQKAQSGDSDAENQLVKYYSPFVVNISTYYAAQLGKELTDVVQAGLVGLTNAIRTFDVSTGWLLSTYAEKRIRGNIKEQLDMTARVMRMPDHALRLHSKIKSISIQLAHELGRMPSMEELETRVKKELKDVQ